MKAVMLYGPYDVRVEELSIPKIRSREILVKMRACGVCGTDIEKVHGDFITPPKLGHEVTGEVVDVGGKIEEFKVGDRVFAHHHVPCYRCHYCRHDDYTMCRRFSETNLDPCGLAEYFRVPEENVDKGALLKLPDKISFEIGTLIEPAACCLRGLTKCRFDVGDDVLIIGSGPIGLTMIRLLQLYGAGRITVSEPIEFRRKTARDYGADNVVNPETEDLNKVIRDLTEGRGADLVIMAVGGASAIVQGVDCTRKGGQILLFGAPPRAEILSYDISRIFINEINITPSYSTTEKETTTALRLIESKKLTLQNLITHTFPLTDTLKAIKYAAGSMDALKILIKP